MGQLGGTLAGVSATDLKLEVLCEQETGAFDSGVAGTSAALIMDESRAHMDLTLYQVSLRAYAR
jgi:hypothetical protein